jgi:uncharacterized protein YcbX
MPNTLARIYRFPVKGLRGEALDAAALAAGQGLPHDRRFAIARGDTQLDAAAPHWLPKQWFIMLMRDTGLARLTCRLDVTAETIELHAPGTAPCIAAFGTAGGRAQIETYLNDYLGPRPEGRAHWVEAGQASFTDVPQNCLSLVNLASVRELAAHMGTALANVSGGSQQHIGRATATAGCGDPTGSGRVGPPAGGPAVLDPLRFRANLYVDGVPAWAEFSWVGREIRIGEAMLRIPARIPRCAATAVDPETGERTVNVVKGLRAAYGHYDMGVYAEVIHSGRVTIGDTVVVPDAPRPHSRLSHWLRFFAFLARSAPIVLRRR